MNDNAIGVFDSGLGGLTSVREIMRLMPSEDIIYFGDNKNAPYGSKSPDEIIKLANKNIKLLKSKNVKIILAACGTVSSYMDKLDCDIPLVGIISPACKKAAKLTNNKRIAVMATPAAIKSNSYKKCIESIDKDLFVYQQPCEKLAGLIEQGHISIDNPELDSAVKTYTHDINNLDIDTLILGCTHYPLVIDSITRHLINKKINIVNAGGEVIEELRTVMIKDGLFCSGNDRGEFTCFVSGSLGKFNHSLIKIFNNTANKPRLI